MDHLYTGCQRTDYQRTDYQCTDYQRTDYQRTDCQRTDYQASHPLGHRGRQVACLSDHLPQPFRLR